MPNATLTCIVADGSLPADDTLPRVPTRQDLLWPIGYGGTISLVVQSADGTAFDLDGCSLDLVARMHAPDVVPALAYAAEIDPTPGGEDPPGTAAITLLAADTAELEAGATYLYDVRLTTAGTPPAEWQVVIPSRLTPALAIARAGEPETL